MEHVFNDVCLELEYDRDPIEFNKKLTGPMFIGQGCTKSVGSDSYGAYIVQKKDIGKKTIWGLAIAKSHFEVSWTDGSMTCDGPATWTPQVWIMHWGKTKNGNPKWWYCDENGKRYKGSRCPYGFRGAHEFKNPSF